MKRTALLGAAVAAAVVAGVAAGGIALATSDSHTLHLTTTRLQFVNTSKTTFVEADAVFKTKKAGYETITCNDGGQQIVCSLTIALKGGVLLGNLSIPITSDTSTNVTGKVTGGLGKFAGDKGTIKGVITGKHATYTVKYR